ncbi:PHP domain-containing protein [Stieleria bergensis]
MPTSIACNALRLMPLLLCLASLVFCPGSTATAQESTAAASKLDDAPKWFKGNLHTHSLWSDGDQFPEMIALWYKQRGYNFLALTDHNVLSEGQRWMKEKDIVARSDKGVVDRYRNQFGENWVQTRTSGDPKLTEVRLKPLNEFRALLEQAGQFIMIQAEEISDRAAGKPVHINATNIAEVIQPAGGSTVREAMQNNLRMILQHEKEHGREVLPHINHPNFGSAISAEDLAAVLSERFFEVYNGHPGVKHLGDDKLPSMEQLWDQVNAIRCGTAGAPPIMGIATDDSHEYHGKPGSRPGRGWVMVRSRFLSPEHLIQAMKRGDFYASSGVTLSDVQFNEETRSLQVAIEPEPDTKYQIDFIATLKHHAEGKTDEHDHVGVTVKSVTGTQATYQMRGDELYVRAQITSSQAHTDPSFKNQKEQAWTQPVGWSAAPAGQ